MTLAEFLAEYGLVWGNILLLFSFNTRLYDLQKKETLVFTRTLSLQTIFKLGSFYVDIVLDTICVLENGIVAVQPWNVSVP